jgi:LCP family protein required for cell wall assembly
MEANTDDPDVVVVSEPVVADEGKEGKKARKLKKPKQPWSLKKRIIVWTLVGIGAIILACVAYVGWKFVYNAEKATDGNILGLLSSTKLDGEAQGRVNILLAGNSADDPGHGGANLTDSIMIISIDTKNNTAFALSIPRDLWVDVPGQGYEKINAVYPQGGMKLLEQVVDKDFGLNMNYYALVNYTAFKDAVNAVGGITVNIQSSDSRGIYDPNISAADDGPLRLKNGLQQLNGQTALNLARARNDPTPSGLVGYGLPNGDFDRAANQRLMLVALKNKVFTSGVAANPVKIGQLFDALGSNVKTDFQTNQLRRLYTIGKGIDSANIKSLSLTTNKLITDYTASDGEDALVPTAGMSDFSQIQFYIKQLTSNNPVTKEGAKVVVLNASGVSGLAKSTSTKLENNGIDVISYGNASGVYTTNEIIDNSKGGKPLTLKSLEASYGSTLAPASYTTTALSNEYPTANFIVILGPQATTGSSGTTTGN